MKNVIKLFGILFLVSGAVFVSCKDEDKEKDPDPVKVTGVSLEKKTLKMAVGESETLKAMVIPAEADDKSITWETNNDEVVEVDATGLVTAKGVGKAKITVRTKDGNFTDVCDVEVELAIEDNFKIEASAGIVVDGVFYTTRNLSVVDSSWIKDNVYHYWNSSSGNVITSELRVKNTSETTIPAGTPYKFSVKRNGNLVGFEVSGSIVTVIEAELKQEIKVNETLTILSENPFRVSRTITGEVIGDNSYCLEVIQMGTEPYPSPVTGCFNYKLELKTP